MEFTKMHGAGNDFIVINNIEMKIPEAKLGQLAEKLCRRRFSIGADGFMVIDSAEYGGDYKMRFYNADGSFGEMCGNGARCIARFGYENGLAGEVQQIETIAGMVTGYRVSETIYKIRLNDVTVKKSLEIEACGKKYDCMYIELGDPGIPHVVLKIDGMTFDRMEELLELGKALRNYKGFPKGANVNFYDEKEDGSFVAMTYERGVENFTLACGTGTASVVVALKERGRTDGKDVPVQVPEGTLTIDIEEDGVYLSGPTEVVFEGYVNVKDIVK